MLCWILHWYAWGPDSGTASHIFWGILCTARQLNPSSPRSWGAPGTAGEGHWVLTGLGVAAGMCPCQYVNFFWIIRKYLFSTNVQKELNHTLFTFPSASPPVMRKVYMNKIFSAFLSNTVWFCVVTPILFPKMNNPPSKVTKKFDN